MSAPRTTGRLLEGTVAGVLTTWLAVTALSQHPVRSFDRLRPLDRSGVAIPNWRFFAPEPARHDFRILHRYLRHDGSQTEWAESNVISPRMWRQSFWFPQRRADKAIFDVCSEILMRLRTPGLDVTTLPGYRLLRDFVAVRLAEQHVGPDPQGFQFLMVSDSGHDTDEEPTYLFASGFEAWERRAGR